MVMEPTVFVFSVMVIANIKSSSQNENSLEKYSELIDHLFAEAEENAKPTPVEDTTIIQNTVKGSEKDLTIGKETWREFSTETVANISREPDINAINSTKYDVSSNDTEILVLNNITSSEKILEHFEDEKVDSDNMKKFTSSKIGVDKNLEDPKILGYLTDNTNSKPSLDDHGEVYDTAEPRYINSASVENNNRVPWYNSRERFEDRQDNDDLSNIFNSRRSFTGSNNTLRPVIENQKDGNPGLGVVLKEEIVFEIEDDKPPALSNSPIEERLQHTTTPNPTVLLFQPKMRSKTMNNTYINFSPSTVLSPQRVLVNKSIYEQMKAHKNIYFNVSNNQKLLSPKRIATMTSSLDNHLKNIRPAEYTRHLENELKLQTEFKKLNDKINTLQEFLNNTIGKKNKTKTLKLRMKHTNPELKNSNKTQFKTASLLRTGHTDTDPSILHRTVVNRIVNNGAPPLMSYANQRIMENILPERSMVTPAMLLSQVPLLEPRLQRRLMLLELANIAKLKHDIGLITRMRKRAKYVLPVYRRRVILKPLGRIL